MCAKSLQSNNHSSAPVRRELGCMIMGAPQLVAAQFLLADLAENTPCGGQRFAGPEGEREQIA